VILLGVEHFEMVEFGLQWIAHVDFLLINRTSLTKIILVKPYNDGLPMINSTA
jgi:hypothetical protein